MSFPPRCKSCGYPLGDYREAFVEAARAKQVAHFVATDNTVDPTNLSQITTDVKPANLATTIKELDKRTDSYVGKSVDQFAAVGDILDGLAITHQCCRAQMIATVDFFAFRNNIHLSFHGEGTLTGEELRGETTI